MSKSLNHKKSHRLQLLATLLATALLAGCATGPQANPNDPLEPWNLVLIHIFNPLSLTFHQSLISVI